jgi:predicted RNA-binding Zn ribbon-like protein
MEQSGTGAGTLTLLGGRVCLDFANTADWHASDQPVEFLTSYSGLVAWARHAGLLTDREAQRLLDEADHRPAEAAVVLQRAVVLREVIYRLFSAIAQGSQPQPADLEAFNRALSEALARSGVEATEDGFSWVWTGDEGVLDRMLWPVLRDAADLLTSAELGRVGQCGDARCGWLFLDASRNRSRRWCSMEDCGNRAKARRYYARKRRKQGA